MILINNSSISSELLTSLLATHYYQKTLTFAWRGLLVVTPSVLSREVLNQISMLSSWLPASPYGPSCLSLDGCSPCPCPSSLWALASSMLRTKALTWLRETSTFFSCGKCVGEAQRHHLILDQLLEAESTLIYCWVACKCASTTSKTFLCNIPLSKKRSN